MDKPKNILASTAFTLLEIMVVVLAIGILIRVAVVQYNRAVENSRKDIAKTVLVEIARSNRKMALDGKGFAGFSTEDVHGYKSKNPLVQNGYMASSQLNSQYYFFNGAYGGTDTAPCFLAKATRKTEDRRGSSVPQTVLCVNDQGDVLEGDDCNPSAACDAAATIPTTVVTTLPITTTSTPTTTTLNPTTTSAPTTTTMIPPTTTLPPACAPTPPGGQLMAFWCTNVCGGYACDCSWYCQGQRHCPNSSCAWVQQCSDSSGCSGEKKYQYRCTCW